jgi:integrase
VLTSVPIIHTLASEGTTMAARPIKPWYRKDRDTWFITFHGRQIPLAKGKSNRAEAEKEFARVVYDSQPRPKIRGDLISAAQLAARWLESCRRSVAPDTYERYEAAARSWLRFFGDDRPADSAREADVMRWAKSQEWAGSTQKTSVGALNTMFTFGTRNRLVSHNPTSTVRIGKSASRLLMMSAQQTERLFEQLDGRRPDLHNLCRFCYLTGCRPSEAYRLEARHLVVERQVAVLPSGKTTAITGRPRKIYLGDEAQQLVLRLAGIRPSGPLFVNTLGHKWEDSSVSKRMRRVRAELGYGPECTLESFRHQWITDALEQGKPIATVAELCGTSPTMIARTYSKLRERTDHLSQAAASVRHEAQPDEPRSAEEPSPP